MKLRTKSLATHWPASLGSAKHLFSPETICALGGYLMLAAVSAPVLRNWQLKPRDDFPLSHYPMFSAKRRRCGTVVHLVATGSDGIERNVPYSVVGTGGFNQVRRQIVKKVQTASGAEQLVREVMSTLIEQGKEPKLVRVVRSTFDYDAFFAGRRDPVKVKQIAATTQEGR